jgi:hypothetical protein
MVNEKTSEVGSQDELRTKYFIKEGDGPEREVTVEQYCRAERRSGFYPRGIGPDDPRYLQRPATAGFGSSFSNVSGRIQYV